MRYRLSINVGFVTNSSSVIYHFPREVLEAPEVRLLMEKFEVLGGFVARDLMDRSQCDTAAVTSEQKVELREMIASVDRPDYAPVVRDDDSVVVIYGDEYDGLARSLAAAMRAVAERLGLAFERNSFN